MDANFWNCIFVETPHRNSTYFQQASDFLWKGWKAAVFVFLCRFKCFCHGLILVWHIFLCHALDRCLVPWLSKTFIIDQFNVCVFNSRIIFFLCAFSHIFLLNCLTGLRLVQFLMSYVLMSTQIRWAFLWSWIKIPIQFVTIDFEANLMEF